MRKRDFKLVLIGDGKQLLYVANVGKSTFVSALINEDPRKSAHVAQHPPVQLPPEMFQNPECNTILYDTHCQPHQIPEEVNQADVILLMYAIDNDGSSERLKRFWLKELSEKGRTQPVIIVGNKLDLMGQDEEREYHRIFKVIKQLVRDFNCVEMGIECSSIKTQGIYDVINCAQRSFLYPLAPIYSIADKSLTEGFKKALTRIFRICDRDSDGVWSDAELEKFQKKVFKRQLDGNDIAGIKDMIEEELHDNSNKQHITLQGFMALQKRGIELMKIQICWTILRFFNYQDNLTLDDRLFTNELIFDQDAGQTVELSDLALQNLKRIYELIGSHNDIFYPVMCKSSFPHHSQYYPLSHEISLTQWLSMWNAFSFFNYKEAYKLLVYIGIEIRLSDTFKEQNRKDSWSSVQKNIDRRVFHIAIVTQTSQKANLLEKYFNNLTPIITNLHNKTYVISLYDADEAEQQIEKRRLSIVDYLLIDENCGFDTAQLIPISKFENNVPFWTQIQQISDILHQQPFGYSEIQIQQLKQQNSLPIFELSLGVAVLGILGITGGYYLKKNGYSKSR